mgnify:CR=1 FL=1
MGWPTNVKWGAIECTGQMPLALKNANGKVIIKIHKEKRFSLKQAA